MARTICYRRVKEIFFTIFHALNSAWQKYTSDQDTSWLWIPAWKHVFYYLFLVTFNSFLDAIWIKFAGCPLAVYPWVTDLDSEVSGDHFDMKINLNMCPYIASIKTPHTPTLTTPQSVIRTTFAWIMKASSKHLKTYHIEETINLLSIPPVDQWVRFMKIEFTFTQ